MTTTTYRVGLCAILFLAACADVSGGDPGASEDELGRRTGLSLREEGPGGLRIDVGSEVKRTSLEASLKRVRARRGDVAFDAYCGIRTTLEAGGSETVLACTKYTSEVSARQKLDFQIVKRGEAFTLEGVTLVGGHLTREHDALTGGAAGPVALEVHRSTASPADNPFVAVAKAEAAFAPLLGTTAWSESAGAEKAIERVELRVDEYFFVSGTLGLAGVRHAPLFERFSLLKIDWRLGEGFADDATVAERAQVSLPKPPRCEEAGPAGSTTNPVPSIQNAVSPLGGPTFGLAHEIAMGELPAPVVREARKAAEEIRARRFEGTDYIADVAGIYAIQASCDDPTIVAYVVYGTGSGEPDYHDGIVIGIDLRGARVFEIEDQG